MQQTGLECKNYLINHMSTERRLQTKVVLMMKLGKSDDMNQLVSQTSEPNKDSRDNCQNFCMAASKSRRTLFIDVGDTRDPCRDPLVVETSPARVDVLFFS